MDKLINAVEEEKARAQYEKEKALQDADNSELIDELIRRGVEFSTVWGRYYEHEEATNGRDLSVGDARLAGFDGYEQLRLF